MMDALVAKAKSIGIKTIYGYYYPTVKNVMVKDFYAKQDFSKEAEDEKGNSVWRFDIPEQYKKKQNVIEISEE